MFKRKKKLIENDQTITFIIFSVSLTTHDYFPLIVPASCGDYVAEDYPDHTYLSSYRFVPHQDASMQRKIMENHKKHV